MGMTKNIGILIVAVIIDGLQVTFALAFFIIGISLAGAGVPFGTGLGIVVNTILGMLGGFVMVPLLAANNTFYPGRIFAAFLSESLIPILNNLPIWTIVVATSIFKKEVRKHVTHRGLMHTLTDLPRTVARGAVGSALSQPSSSRTPTQDSLEEAPPQGPATAQPPQRIALQDIRAAKPHAQTV